MELQISDESKRLIEKVLENNFTLHEKGAVKIRNVEEYKVKPGFLPSGSRFFLEASVDEKTYKTINLQSDLFEHCNGMNSPLLAHPPSEEELNTLRGFFCHRNARMGHMIITEHFKDKDFRFCRRSFRVTGFGRSGRMVASLVVMAEDFIEDIVKSGLYSHREESS